MLYVLLMILNSNPLWIFIIMKNCCNRFRTHLFEHWKSMKPEFNMNCQIALCILNTYNLHTMHHSMHCKLTMVLLIIILIALEVSSFAGQIIINVNEMHEMLWFDFIRVRNYILERRASPSICTQICVITTGTSLPAYLVNFVWGWRTWCKYKSLGKHTRVPQRYNSWLVTLDFMLWGLN